jgi:hypothetical protein
MSNLLEEAKEAEILVQESDDFDLPRLPSESNLNKQLNNYIYKSIHDHKEEFDQKKKQITA